MCKIQQERQAGNECFTRSIIDAIINLSLLTRAPTVFCEFVHDKVVYFQLLAVEIFVLAHKSFSVAHTPGHTLSSIIWP